MASTPVKVFAIAAIVAGLAACKQTAPQSAGTTAPPTGSTTAGGSSGGGTSVPTLVSVNLQNVLNQLSVSLNVNRDSIPVTAQVPIDVAASVCGVSVSALAASVADGHGTCTAVNTSPALLRWCSSRSRRAGMSVAVARRRPFRRRPLRLRQQTAADPSLIHRGSGHFLELFHQRPVREWTVADACHPGACPFRFGRSAGEGNDVEWQRHFANHAFNVTAIRQARDEESARAGIGERLAALDHPIDERVIVVLVLQEQIRSRVDEEIRSDGSPDCGNAALLQVERVNAFAADHLIFEIATGRAGLGKAGDVTANFIRFNRVTAFEVDRHRKVYGIDDPLGVGQREVDWHTLAV